MLAYSPAPFFICPSKNLRDLQIVLAAELSVPVTQTLPQTP